MKPKLRQDGKMRYSPMEKELFEYLSTRPQTSVKIREKFYGSDDPPFYSRQIIVGLLRALEKKVKANREPFVINSTDRSGPIPVSFWIEPK